jgi:acetolactate synthase-1/2/3 large subunit
MTGADAIVHSLRAHGVDTIFALPGGQLDHFFDAMYRSGKGLRVIPSRHEQGVAYMAYGYARSTGKVGVYAVVPGPGLLNSSAALCTAWGNGAKVLCLSGQIPSTAIGKGYGELHEIPDQLGMIRHITKWAARIDSPAATPELVREAMRQLHEGRPRPVELEMAMDIMGQSADVDLRPVDVEIRTPAVDPDQINAAARILGKARRPLIVVGGGAIDAAAEVLAIAEKLQAPVISKRNGKGIVTSRHYLHANLPMGHALWGKADAVLAVGTRLKEPLTMWGKDDDLPLVRVDIDPEELTRICVPEVGIVGEARVSLGALCNALDATNGKRESVREEMLALRNKVDAEMRSHMAPQMGYLDVIRRQLPDDGVFVDEITQVGFASWAGFPVYAPRQHVTAGEMGTLGYGFATALGVTVGNPGKRIIQISGDGGFMFNVQELSTAVQYRIPLTTVIFNDNCFGNVQRQQDEWFEGRRLCSDLRNPDFARLAEVFGATGMRAASPAELGQALERAGQVQGPVLIEVPVRERMPTPWRFIMMPQNRKSLCQ